jgi:signal transduction histidine kinase/CheY-like chemotaxis protein
MNIRDIDAPSWTRQLLWLKELASQRQGQFFSMHRTADTSLRYVEVNFSTIHLRGTTLLYCIVQDKSEQQHFRVLTDFRLRLLEMSHTASIEEMLTFTLDEAERLTGSTVGFFNFVTDERAVLRHACSSNSKLDNCGHAPHPTVINFGVSSDIIREKQAVIHNDHATLRHCNCDTSPHTPSIRELIVPVLHNGNVMAILEIGNKPVEYHENDIRLLSTLTGVAWDIIAKKYAEASEQKTQEAMQYTQKMELIGQLAGGIAHDINNVLMVVLGHAEMLLVEMNNSPFSENLAVIRDSCIRAANLIQQLLAFARKQTIQPVVLRLDHAISESLPMLRELVGSRINLEWRPGADDAQVVMDPSQLDQIMTNLCANAREAITGHGSVIIQTSNIQVTPSDCFSEHPCQTPGNFVQLTVSDSGCGIEHTILPHIFEPFFTTREVGKGSGLGLSTVYGIVKQNKGCLDCQSEPGKGARFTMYLPTLDSSPEQCSRQPRKEPDKCNRRKTVLLVDRDPAIIHLVGIVVEKNGFTMLSASSPEEAMNLVMQSKVTIDLLLTDSMIPEMLGLKLSEQMRIICPGMKTIFMSASAVETVRTSDQANSDSLVIVKPFRIHELTSALRTLLA